MVSAYPVPDLPAKVRARWEEAGVVNEPGAWLVTSGWSVGRVLQPLLSPPLPSPEQNLVSGQPLGPWHQEKRAGSAAAGAFVFTSPQLASC